jgi:hypothetical protein
MAKRRSDKTMVKIRTEFNGQKKDRQHNGQREEQTKQWPK